MKTNLLLPALFFITSFLWAQNPSVEWVNSAGSSDSDKAYAVTTDSQSNVIVTGYFHNTADFDPGPGELNLTSNGNEDIFIQKLDADGHLIWAKQIGGSNNDSGVSVVTDANDNIYVTGWFSTTVDFDPGTNTFDLVSAGSWDIFVLKLDTNGNFVWVKQFGSSNLDYAAGLVLDSAGNIYLTGMFKNTIDFDPGFDVFTLTPQSWDVFVLKLDNDGRFQWAQKFGGSSYDKARAIAIDTNDNIYIGGQFKDTVDFDNSNNTYELTSAGLYDAFVLKLDNNGNFVWVKQFGSNQNEDTTALTTDDNNNVYIAGYFKETVDFDPGAGVFNISTSGEENSFYVKLDINGDFQWATSLPGTDDNRTFGMDLGANDQLFLCGYFKDTVSPSWVSGYTAFTSHGFNDAFIAGINQSDGGYRYFKQIGGSGYDYAYHVYAKQPNALYVSGTYEYTVNFSDTSNDTTYEQTAVDDNDIFVLKLNLDTNTILNQAFTDIKVYPNPAHDYVVIDLGQYMAARIKLYDAYGREIYNIPSILNKSVSMPLPGLKGLYFLEVQAGGQSKRYKIIKK